MRGHKATTREAQKRKFECAPVTKNGLRGNPHYAVQFILLVDFRSACYTASKKAAPYYPNAVHVGKVGRSVDFSCGAMVILAPLW